MSDSFEIKKNTKAFSYTALICGLFLLIAIWYTWPLQVSPTPVAQDLIEINLGNEKEGAGDVQPLVKGDPAPDVKEVYTHTKYSPAKEEPAKDIEADEKDDPEAAPVTKPVKVNPEAKNIAKETVTKPVKNSNPAPVVAATPTPPKPKLPLYKGGNGTGGNGATEDNGYRNQGYKGGSGDAGSPDGKPDSYGSSPGGRSGGKPEVTSGDRKIIRYYAFTGELEKATIYAVIKVAPDGHGSFAGFGKNSSTTNPAYANEISEHLHNIQFDKSDHESTVIVRFNFNVN
jgi:hypothetical protein